VKTPPPDLAERLLDVSEQILRSDPAPRLEDVARMVGASRASLYYYFSGRDDLLSFLLTTHARHGAEAIHAAVDPDAPPPQRLREMLGAMIEYLAQHPGTCAGLLGAVGANGQMSEVLQTNDTWIAGPLRDLLANKPFAVHNVADAANAILGAALLAVLGRSMAGADPTDPAFRRHLIDQILLGVLG
jgi:TetR/AcrR family transcriptional regulator